jgi:hypothetical protein
LRWKRRPLDTAAGLTFVKFATGATTTTSSSSTATATAATFTA